MDSRREQTVDAICVHFASTFLLATGRRPQPAELTRFRLRVAFLVEQLDTDDFDPEATQPGFTRRERT